MTIDTNNLLDSILESISQVDYVHSADVPNIDLYMDQVTTFMESQLSSTKRYENDKILTKTMINNYTKNKLLPPPDKKKYSREHMLILIFIYYFKNILSIKDIQTLLNPVTNKYFHKDDEMSLTDIYEEICSSAKEQLPGLQDRIKDAYTNAASTFSDVPETDRGQLQFFAFICNLCLDIYVKQLLVEKLLDETEDSDISFS